ncbi:MAG: HAMP domain-containing histidine kinase [Clostridia bacterium]|nr:HAMP domain-containing histidine kinase [Clostridia bacterium]
MFCIVCVCTSGVAVSRVADFGIQAGYYYGMDTIIKSRGDVERSVSFLYEVGLSYYALRRAFVTYNDGAIFEDEAFKKHLEEKTAERIEEYVNDRAKEFKQYADEYNDWLLTDYDEHYDNYYWLEGYGQISPSETNPFVGSNFVRNDDGTVGVNYERLRREAKDNLGYDYDPDVYKNEYKHLKSYISTLGALQYFLVDNTTGKVYTNSGFETAEEFKEAYAEKNWFVSSTDNFETVTVGNKFKKFSETSPSALRYSYGEEADIVQTQDGIILSPSAYTYEFFTAIRYGYSHYTDRYGYIVGSTSLFEAGPCTVYLGYESAKASANDPFIAIEKEYGEAVSGLEAYAELGLVSLALLIILTLVILFLAGKKPVHLNWQNKIPGDIHLIVSIAAAIGMGVLAFWCAVYTLEYYYRREWIYPLGSAGCIASAVVCYSFLINGLVTLIQNIAGKVFVKRLFILLPIRLIKRLAQRLAANRTNLKNGVRRRFVIVVPIYAVILAACWLTLAATTWEVGLAIFIGIVLLLVSVAFFVLIYYYAKALDKIRETVAKTQQGDFDVQFDCNSMPKAMVDFASDISEMRSGMKLAVDSAVREQKAKTELITNVSHDLKTPLTSIITYADLIARSTEGNEEVKEYSEVLTEKSMRLKHLIEDLTEATRVSTGAIELHPTKVDLCELAAQAVGENTGAFEKSGVEPIINNNGTKPVVFADGQKTYRVLENIISNITKYSLPGTRAYVTVGEENGMGMVMFRNISAAPLNISADELMERFVRGDSARTGEGSGLGLSIARDLCELQGGRFEISIDGDMFTSRVYLPMR